MKLSLSDEYRLNHALSSAGLFLFILLLLPCLLFFSFCLFLKIKHPELTAAAELVDGAAGIIICDLGIWFCLRRRQFLLKFCRWQEFEVPADLPESRHLLGLSRDAFMGGLWQKAARLLERYLEQRPADNVARINLAACQVQDGRIEQAVPNIEICGDPRRQLKSLRPRPGLGRFLLFSRPFSDAQVARAALLWPMLLRFTLFFGGLAFVAAREEGKIEDWAQLREKILAIGLHESDFNRLETDDIIYFYHDERLLKQAREYVERALDYDLRFLDLPPTLFHDHKIRFFICESREEYMHHSAFAKSWEGGVAVPKDNVFYTYILNKKLTYEFCNTVAHELCHICYYHINPEIGSDSWLNEGLASYQGYSYECELMNVPPAATIKDWIFRDITKNPLPFEIFLHDRPQSLTAVADVNKFYVQGHSMVYVLIHFYGKDQFLKFIHKFALTQDMNKALNDTYETIHSLDDLYPVWTLFMK